MGVAAINLGVVNLTPTLRTDAANRYIFTLVLCTSYGRVSCNSYLSWEFSFFYAFRLLSLTERFQQLWMQQYQNPSNGLNNIIGALNASIQRLLANVDTSDL